MMLLLPEALLRCVNGSVHDIARRDVCKCFQLLTIRQAVLCVAVSGDTDKTEVHSATLPRYTIQTTLYVRTIAL
jgi:hypothetical protein